MFIGIAGSTCSGKHTIAEYLIKEHNFEFLALNTGQDISQHEHMYKTATRFDTLEDMQTYVTGLWQENFVTCNVEVHDLWTLK